MKGGENMWVYWKYGHLPRRFRRRRFNERLEFLLLLGAERAVEHLCIIKISWRLVLNRTSRRPPRHRPPDAPSRTG